MEGNRCAEMNPTSDLKSERAKGSVVIVSDSEISRPNNNLKIVWIQLEWPSNGWIQHRLDATSEKRLAPGLCIHIQHFIENRSGNEFFALKSKRN